MSATPPVLRIVVSPGCAGSRPARACARAVRRARPGYPVEVIDLARQTVPAGIIGTPTYLLGDDVVSLGNPELADLLLLLDDAMVDGAVDAVTPTGNDG